MKAPEALRGTRSGQEAPELSRLKALPGADRKEIYSWRFEEAPSPTNAEIRERIAEQFGIQLKRDGQLSVFWPWQFRQSALEDLGETMSATEGFLADKFPKLTRDQCRDISIKQGYAIANAINDPKLAMRVAAEDRKDKELTLDRERFEFDAAKACLKTLPSLKAIASDKGLSEPEKVQQIRLKLFGVVA